MTTYALPKAGSLESGDGEGPVPGPISNGKAHITDCGQPCESGRR